MWIKCYLLKWDDVNCSRSTKYNTEIVKKIYTETDYHM